MDFSGPRARRGQVVLALATPFGGEEVICRRTTRKNPRLPAGVWSALDRRDGRTSRSQDGVANHLPLVETRRRGRPYSPGSGEIRLWSHLTELMFSQRGSLVKGQVTVGQGLTSPKSPPWQGGRGLALFPFRFGRNLYFLPFVNWGEAGEGCSLPGARGWGPPSPRPSPIEGEGVFTAGDGFRG
jgi:hypothetical protein